MKPNKSNKKIVSEGLSDDALAAECEHEVQMARADCFYAAKDAVRIHSILKQLDDGNDLDDAIVAKIDAASKALQDVVGYFETGKLPADGIVSDLGTGIEEGYTVLPPIDRERYTEIPELEGPFMLRNGSVVYYDPKVGRYYDRDTDMYLSDEEYFGRDQVRDSHIAEAVAKIACIKCDAISTEKAWKKNGGTCPKCKKSTQGVATESLKEDIGTLSKYIKKASSDVMANSAEAGIEAGQGKDFRKQKAKADKRHQGIHKATDKLVKKATVGEEATSKSDYYVRKTAPDVWRVMKNGQSSEAGPGPFASAKEAASWIKNKTKLIKEAPVKQITVKDIAGAISNTDDWGDFGDYVFIKGKNLVVVDTYYYGGNKAMQNLIDNWTSPKGSYAMYWKEKFNVEFDLVDTFEQVNATGKFKKLTTDGIVGVELAIRNVVSEAGKKNETCESCGGTGMNIRTIDRDPKACPACDGWGSIDTVIDEASEGTADDPEVLVPGYGMLTLSTLATSAKRNVKEIAEIAARATTSLDWSNIAYLVSNGVLKAKADALSEKLAEIEAEKESEISETTTAGGIATAMNGNGFANGGPGTLKRFTKKKKTNEAVTKGTVGTVGTIGTKDASDTQDNSKVINKLKAGGKHLLANKVRSGASVNKAELATILKSQQEEEK